MTKEDRENRKQLILSNIRWEIEDPYSKGGQSVGIMPKKVTLICDDLDIKISVGYERSSLRNKEKALLIFDLALEDILT